MADLKISQLTAITTLTPATDVLPVVDVTGTTKKITTNQILGSGGTATLASATITGDLTVDTSTLKVDSANNRVGIGTATPARPLDIVGSFQSSLGWVLTGTPAGLGAATRYIGGASTTDSWYYNGLTGGSHIWAFGESTAMTLNATGLGVGVASPVEKLTVAGRGLFVSANPDNAALKLEASTGTNSVAINFVNTGGDYFVGVDNSVGGRLFGVPYSLCIGSTGAYPVVIATNNTARLTVDATGNLLVGTTSGSFGSRLIISTDTGTTKWATGPFPGGPTNYYITANNTQGVFLNGTTATAWTAISDERLKDIIEPISNAVAKVGLLRSVIGKFKTDVEGTRRSFLIAQDVLAAFPEAAVATNPDKLAVTYTEVIPLLVAAIKELAAEVNALKKA